MTTFDEAALKRAVTALNKAPASLSEHQMPPARSRTSQVAITKLLEPALTKARLDVAKLNKLLAQSQSEQRAAFQKQKDEAAKNAPAAEKAYRDGIAMMQQAQALLSQPFTSTIVTLPKPIFILQQPTFEINNFIDNHVEPFNSSIQYKVETNSDADNTFFNFYFIWQNPVSTPAVINVSAPFVFTGACNIEAAQGFFSGDTTDLSLLAEMSLLRWTGWGNDPHTGDGTYIQNPTGTPVKQVMHLHAHGGSVFGDSEYANKIFSNQSVPLNTTSVVVPGHAVLMIQMGLNFYFGFDDGGNISDYIGIDFAGNGHMIRCPAVQIEVLTPVARSTTLETAPPLANDAALTH